MRHIKLAKSVCLKKTLLSRASKNWILEEKEYRPVDFVKAVQRKIVGCVDPAKICQSLAVLGSGDKNVSSEHVLIKYKQEIFERLIKKSLVLFRRHPTLTLLHLSQ